jgi:PPOX class probable F420-dependent enzyme
LNAEDSGAGSVGLMLDTEIRDLARGKNFATLTVIPKSGHPMTHVMWVDADDTHVLINTELGRAKATAMDNDARVTVTVIDATNPYHYAEVRGHVVASTVGKEAADHIDALATKYTGANYRFGPTDRRIIYRVEPLHQRTM